MLDICECVMSRSSRRRSRLKQGPVAVLNWGTAMEFNNEGFVVLRSNGIGVVSAVAMVAEGCCQALTLCEVSGLTFEH